MRFKIIRIIIFSLLTLIALNLFYAQIIRGHYYYNLSMRNRIRVVPLDGVRGRIFDRKGILLADNELSFDVSVVPQDINDEDELFKYLSQLLNVDPEELRKRFKRRFLTPFAPVAIAYDVPREVAIAIEENKFRFPGLMIEESHRRIYPQGSIGAHIVGYVGKISRAKMEQLKDYGYTMQSMVGYSGVEEYYDDVLRGESGGRQIEINNRGQEVTLLGLKNPSVGRDIVLTVDSRIQEIADELLGARRGSVVVMDLANGEVLGMVSSPAYDPNDFADANQRSRIEKYFHDGASPLLNRAVNSHFPPGSVFKIPVAIAGLETDLLTRNTTFICPGDYLLGHRFGCTHVHNDQNLIQAIAHSCNVYFYHAGLLIGSDEIKRFARMLGLSGKTNIDLPFEAQGATPSRSSRRKGQWFTGDTLNFSIGQGGVTATPLQLVKMMSIVANRGKVVGPHLIQSIDEHPVAMEKYFSGPVHFKMKTFDVVEEGLADAIQEAGGTAHALDISGLQTFGKTGTAQAGDGRDHHAWFVGYTKSANKNIVYCVFLENGGSSYNAVVLARELLLRMQGLGII